MIKNSREKRMVELSAHVGHACLLIEHPVQSFPAFLASIGSTRFDESWDAPPKMVWRGVSGTLFLVYRSGGFPSI